MIRTMWFGAWFDGRYVVVNVPVDHCAQVSGPDGRDAGVGGAFDPEYVFTVYLRKKFGSTEGFEARLGECFTTIEALPEPQLPAVRSRPE